MSEEKERPERKPKKERPPLQKRTCIVCNGTGKVAGQKCRVCDETGQMY